MPAIQKICCACNADVSGKKRVKDPQGHYYCQACYDARAQQKHAAPPVPAAIAAGAALLDEELADDGEIGLAEELVPATPVQEEMFGCADCKSLVPKRQIRNDDGEFVCVPCFTKRRSATRKTTKSAPAPRKSFAEEEGGDGSIPFAHTMLGGTVISAAILAGAFAAFIGLGIAMPEKGQSGLIFPILMAIFEVIFALFKAGALIGSMFMASNIVGGCDFGYLGSALWKSIAIVVGFGFLSFFMERNEELFMLGLAFRGIIFLLTFVIVFKLDFFEAMILSVVNYLVFWGLTIAMAILLVHAQSAFMPHHAFDDEDDTPPAFAPQNPGNPAPPAPQLPPPPAAQPAPQPAPQAAPQAAPQLHPGHG